MKTTIAISICVALSLGVLSACSSDVSESPEDDGIIESAVSSSDSSDLASEEIDSNSPQDEIEGRWHIIGVTDDYGNMEYTDYLADSTASFESSGAVSVVIGSTEFSGVWQSASYEGEDAYAVDLGNEGGLWIGKVRGDTLILVNWADESSQIAFSK